jgi:hypothetical protein
VNGAYSSTGCTIETACSITPLPAQFGRMLGGNVLEWRVAEGAGPHLGYAIPLSLVEIDACGRDPGGDALSKLKQQLDWRLHDLRRTVRTGMSPPGHWRDSPEF